jgi:hypothetical protein
MQTITTNINNTIEIIESALPAVDSHIELLAIPMLDMIAGGGGIDNLN